jgi:hypothetical protein
MSSRIKRAVIAVAVAVSLLAGVAVWAQVKRPYRDGSVWSIAFIKVKPGMDVAYMNHLSGPWKAEQEAAKKEGLILSYKVLVTEAHGTSDWNLLLMTEYKDLASMEAGQDKFDARAQKVIGDDQTQMQGYKDRLEIREVMGSRLAREVILEPKK